MLSSSNNNNNNNNNNIQSPSTPNTSISSFVSSSTIPQPSPRVSLPNDILRSRNQKKDNLIRRKAEMDVNRTSNQKNPSTPTSTSVHRSRPNTVASLKPLSPILLLASVTIVQASIQMAAKKSDSILVVDVQGKLIGILTDKDIAYRVIAASLDPRVTVIGSVMTPNPTFVYESDGRSEALAVMSERKFRHLPVVSEEQKMSDVTLSTNSTGKSSVVGVLDITKCVFDRLGELEVKVNEDKHIIHAMEALEKNGAIHGGFASNVI